MKELGKEEGIWILNGKLCAFLIVLIVVCCSAEFACIILLAYLPLYACYTVAVYAHYLLLTIVQAVRRYAALSLAFIVHCNCVFMFECCCCCFAAGKMLCLPILNLMLDCDRLCLTFFPICCRYGDLSFDDIAGQDQAKGEVKEITDMLRDPDRYYSVGARLPSGILLVGPPGSGKTLLARVTAAEARVPFYSCSASDFVEVFVGRGPARVRKLFERAAQNAPSIIFIDEIDSIGRSRRMGSMNSEQESTLNQILTCMDGLDTSNNGVIVMAATNRLELLDSALLRAGRFDRIVQCPLPDKGGRLEILKVYTRKLKLHPMVDLDK